MSWSLVHAMWPCVELRRRDIAGGDTPAGLGGAAARHGKAWRQARHRSAVGDGGEGYALPNDVACGAHSALTMHRACPVLHGDPRANPRGCKPAAAASQCKSTPFCSCLARFCSPTPLSHPAGAASQHSRGTANASAAHHPDALLQKAIQRHHIEGPVIHHPQGALPPLCNCSLCVQMPSWKAVPNYLFLSQGALGQLTWA